MQIRISISDEEHALLKQRAIENCTSISAEARKMIHKCVYATTREDHVLSKYLEKDIHTKELLLELCKMYRIDAHINKPSTIIGADDDKDDESIHDTPEAQPEAQPPFELFREKKRRNYIPDPPDDFTPPAVQQPPQPEIIKTTGYKPEITSTTNIKSEQNQTLPGTGQTPQGKPVIRPQSELEQEDVDSKWDAEGNEYSREDFIQELTEFERRMREDCPSYEDPTQDPDYVKLKNYFVKNDFRQRFRDLLSDPTRFYSEPGVYDNPSLRFAQNAFKKEKIDEDYIVSLLLGTGASYRAKNQSRLYVDDQY